MVLRILPYWTDALNIDNTFSSFNEYHPSFSSLHFTLFCHWFHLKNLIAGSTYRFCGCFLLRSPFQTSLAQIYVFWMLVFVSILKLKANKTDEKCANFYYLNKSETCWLLYKESFICAHACDMDVNVWSVICIYTIIFSKRR